MSSWVTPGYEQLELSTQRLIAAALERDILVEVLDWENQWIRLRKDGRTEIIRQGNETRADSYITSLILGDKGIQKQLLSEASISVPVGGKYHSVLAGMESFEKYKTGRWVIKPTTANYGLGISILPENVAESEFKKALEVAFEHDKSVLVEQFFAGIECRFLVIGGKCRAVLHRVPANVIGDGVSDIETLVAHKNQDPRRGEGYKTPLEKIKITDTEVNILAQQNLKLNDIVEKDQQVWLRDNSNISTGGDSLDYTDLVHEKYKSIAEQAAVTVGANVCGVDMMLSSFSDTPTAANYTIIELNYNPVLYFHDFPYEGKNRNVAPYVLDVLNLT